MFSEADTVYISQIKDTRNIVDKPVVIMCSNDVPSKKSAV